MTRREIATFRQKWAFISHVSTCRVCRRYLRQAIDLGQILDQWEVPGPQRDILAGVMSRIVRPRTHDGRVTAVRPVYSAFLLRLRVPAVVAALVFVALAVSIWLNVQSHISQSGARGVASQVIPLVANGAGLGPTKELNQAPLRSIAANPALIPGPIIVIIGNPLAMRDEVLPEPASKTSHVPL